MKKILTILFTLFWALTSSAQTGVIWETGTINEALKKGETKDKLIFVDCYTKWCGPCRYMEQKVFSTNEAGEYFNKTYVNFKMDMEVGDGVEYANKYFVSAYPTFLILKPDGTEAGRIVGGVLDPMKFIEKVEKALKPENNPKAILEKFDSTGDIKYAYDYVDTLRKTANNGLIREFVINYYHKIPEKEKFTAKFWELTKSAISIRDYRVLDYVMENKLKYDKRFGKARVDNEIATLLYHALTTYVYEGTEFPKENIKKAYIYYTLLNPRMTPWEEYIVNVSQALNNGDYNRFFELSKPSIIFNQFKIMECNIIKYRIAANPGLSQEQKDKFKCEFEIEMNKIIERYQK